MNNVTFFLYFAGIGISLKNTYIKILVNGVGLCLIVTGFLNI
jgi:hypothetical protein